MCGHVTPVEALRHPYKTVAENMKGICVGVEERIILK
jgi:hypothetical protein